MKIILGFLLCLTFSHYLLASEVDTETDNTRTLIIQNGKVISEEHEVDVYDYHTGTFQTFRVYRQPEKKLKAADTNKPETTVKPQ